jgi:hypothetical protein
MAGIYVPLYGPAREALIELSEREFRDPRSQAALLLTQALREAGALPTPQPSERRDGAALAGSAIER